MYLKEIIYVAVGLLAGVINSVAGGGTIIAFPLMMLFRISALGANATTNIPVFLGQISSSLGYLKYFKKIPKKYYLIIIPSIFGTILGAYLLRKTPNSNFEYIAPVLILIAVAAFVYQPYITARIYGTKKKLRSRNSMAYLIYPFVFILAIYGGYYGGGFGLIILVLLSFTKMNNIHAINGLKNLNGIFVSFLSIVVLFNSGLINFKVGLTIGVGSLVGGYLGAKLAPRISLKYLRIVIIIIGLLTALYFVGIKFL